MGFAEDLSSLLSTQGFTASSIFCGDLPERPHQALCVTPTAGLGSLHAFGSVAGGAPAEQVRCQLRARATDYTTAEMIMNAAHSILDGMRARAMNGRLYQWANAVSSPYYIGTDAEDRPLFACNYELVRSLTT